MEPACFDCNGDLWVEVLCGSTPLPNSVQLAGFMRSHSMGGGGYGVAVTKMNLTAYIKNLIKEVT